MAIYRNELSHGSRKGGQSAQAKHAYITRTGDYSKQEDRCLHVESANIPHGVPAEQFWTAADSHSIERARLFSQFVVALPVELDQEQQVALVQDYVGEVIKDHPYTWALHEGKGTNPHAHIIFSNKKSKGWDKPLEQFFKQARKKNPELGGAPTNRKLKEKKYLEEARASWSEKANEHLKQNATLMQKMRGKIPQIDHRSLKDQGIDREPQEKRDSRRQARVQKLIADTEKEYGISHGQEAGEGISSLALEIISENKRDCQAGARRRGASERQHQKENRDLRREVKNSNRELKSTSKRVARGIRSSISVSKSLKLEFEDARESFEHAIGSMDERMGRAKEQHFKERTEFSFGSREGAGRSKLRDQLSLRDFKVCAGNLKSRQQGVHAARRERTFMDATIAQITAASNLIGGWLKESQEQSLAYIRDKVGKLLERFDIPEKIKPRKKVQFFKTRIPEIKPVSIPSVEVKEVKKKEDVFRTTVHSFDLRHQKKAREKKVEEPEIVVQPQRSRGPSMNF